MPTIKIDDKDYDIDAMSPLAKTQLAHLQATDLEIQRLNMHLAIFQTARAGYLTALKQELENPGSSQPSVQVAGPAH